MPRRRTTTITNNAGPRRTTTTIEDGRCNGNKKSTISIEMPKESTTTGHETMGAEATKMTSQSGGGSGGGDSGYLHKKFKKVAATFSTTPEPTAPLAAVEKERAVQKTPPPPQELRKENEDGSKSTKNASGGGGGGGGKYVCHYCQHACAKPSVLEKHIRAHTNERPYPCLPCGFAFKTKSNLYKHCKSRTHVLKLEESSGGGGVTTSSAATSSVPPEVTGSDEATTSDENTPMEEDDEEESDEGVESDPALPPTSGVTSSPDQFKTPYKPKFHNLKIPASSAVDGATESVVDGGSAETADAVVSSSNSSSSGLVRPSAGFLHERISQIISKNQAIVETLDPIWPRRYVRQSSRDSKEQATTTATTSSGTNVNLLMAKHPAVVKLQQKGNAASGGIVARERSCSLNDPELPSIPAVIQHSMVVPDADENHRKRCYSEGPSNADNQLRHSVRNLLHQPMKPPPPAMRISADGQVVNAQNPEGSIIKDILLKSRGLLPDSSGNDVPAPLIPVTKMSSSFTVSALLNPSTSSTSRNSSAIPHHPPPPSLEEDPAMERPAKRARMTPPDVGQQPMMDYLMVRPPHPPEVIRPIPVIYSRNPDERTKTSLPLFGGEVEIHDGRGAIKTVMRIDPSGYSGSVGNAELKEEQPTVIQPPLPTKINLTSGGGIVKIQPAEENRFKLTSTTAGMNIPELVGKPSTVLIQSSSSSSVSSTSSTLSLPATTTVVPYIPGIPGPYSSGGCWTPSVYTSTTSTSSVATASSVPSRLHPLPAIQIHPAHPEETDSSASGSKFFRPTSLSLNTAGKKNSVMSGLDPHSGQPMLCVSGAGMTLISPETPRPRKLIRQMYLNGHAYTSVGLKCSTRVHFCCLSRAQPMYVPQSHPQLSMYSQWTTRPSPDGDGSSVRMALYDSRQWRMGSTTSVAQSPDHIRMILTHSSYWTNRNRPTTSSGTGSPSESSIPVSISSPLPVTSAQPEADPVVAAVTTSCSSSVTDSGIVSAPPQPAAIPAPKRIRIFAGGYKSTEEYVYVRGRGRGRYVCEECGIRCKKPSMLKKHIRTHTDLRPYTCRQCNFSFKTKGNLTKHMKSKAHHKKCTELGIVPVPTTVDDANIDHDSLAQKKMAAGTSGGNSGSDGEEEDDDDDDDDEEDDELEEEEEEEEELLVGTPIPVAATEAAVVVVKDQFADVVVRNEREQEVARSLLDLGVMAPAGCKPTTYPYASRCSHPESHPESIPEEMEVVKEEPKSLPIDLSSANSAHPPAKSVTPPAVIPESIQLPVVVAASSGMLQAYLTEKSLSKEGVIKRHPPIPFISAPHPVAVPSTSGGVEQPVGVTFFPAHSSSRDGFRRNPEFLVPPLSSSSGSSVPNSSAPSAVYKLTDDGKTACSICNKVFTKPSQLRLHINIHYFERPFRCEACAVSFRTKGHLQKHKRSVTHFNKVNMNLTFGTPSTENPRPFKCSDCMIAFRIHGHLAKHLRSKMHIMKLECLGKLPFGTYAEMERSGINLNEIDTTDCHHSLESLQSLAHRLYKQDPTKIQQWQQEAQVAAEANLRERTISGSSEEFSDVADEGDDLDEDAEDSDGLPDATEDALPPIPPANNNKTESSTVTTIHPEEVKQQHPVMYCSACGESCSSMEAFRLHVAEKHPPPPVQSPTPPPHPPSTSDRISPPLFHPVRMADQNHHPPPWNRMTNTPVSSGWQQVIHVNPAAAAANIHPPQWHQDPAAVAWMASRQMHPPPPPPSHSLNLPHNYSAVTVVERRTHPLNGGGQSSSSGVDSNPSPTPAAGIYPCELCGKSFATKETLRLHILAHAQPRPYVCEYCDAGFTTEKQLESHLVLHRPRTS